MDAECADAPAAPRSTRAWIACWIVAGCALRLTGLGVHSLWFDEVAYVYLSSAPNVADALRASRYPPLGCYVLRAWMGIFGESDVMLRALPALLSCAALILFARLAWLWCPVRARASAVALFAVSPFSIWYGQEVASYALVPLGTLIALIAAAQVLASGRVSPAAWAFAAIGTAIAMGTHYMSVVVGGSVVALAAAGWLTSRLDRRTALWLASAPIAGCLVWAPWLLTVFPDQRQTVWGNLAKLDPRDFAELPVRLFTAFSGAIGERWPSLPRVTLAIFGPVYLHEIAIAALIWGGVALQFVEIARHRREKDAWILIVLAAPVASALSLLLVMPPNFAPKYVMAASPGVALAVACGFASLPSRAARVSLAGATIAWCLWLDATHKLENFKEDYRGVCAEIAAAWKPGDAILAVTGLPEPFNQAGFRHYFHDLGERREMLASIRSTSETVPRLPGSLADASRVLVLYRISEYASADMKKLLASWSVAEQEPPRKRIQFLVLKPNGDGR